MKLAYYLFLYTACFFSAADAAAVPQNLAGTTAAVLIDACAAIYNDDIASPGELNRHIRGLLRERIETPSHCDEARILWTILNTDSDAREALSRAVTEVTDPKEASYRGAAPIIIQLIMWIGAEKNHSAETLFEAITQLRPPHIRGRIRR